MIVGKECFHFEVLNVFYKRGKPSKSLLWRSVSIILQSCRTRVFTTEANPGVGSPGRRPLNIQLAVGMKPRVARALRWIV